MDAGPRVEVDFQLEFREFFRALRWYSLKKMWWFYGLCIFVIPPVVVATIFRSDNDPAMSRLAASLMAFVVAIVMALVFYWGIYRNAQRQFNSSSSLCEAHHRVFSDEGIESSSSGLSGKAAWTIFHKALESPEFFFFFTSNSIFNVLPKRVLGSEERIQALRNLILRHLGSKARLKKGAVEQLAKPYV
jgi:hypothetical protein